MVAGHTFHTCKSSCHCVCSGTYALACSFVRSLGKLLFFLHRRRRQRLLLLLVLLVPSLVTKTNFKCDSADANKYDMMIVLVQWMDAWQMRIQWRRARTGLVGSEIEMNARFHILDPATRSGSFHPINLCRNSRTIIICHESWPMTQSCWCHQFTWRWWRWRRCPTKTKTSKVIWTDHFVSTNQNSFNERQVTHWICEIHCERAARGLVCMKMNSSSPSPVGQSIRNENRKHKKTLPSMCDWTTVVVYFRGPIDRMVPGRTLNLWVLRSRRINASTIRWRRCRIVVVVKTSVKLIVCFALLIRFSESIYRPLACLPAHTHTRAHSTACYCFVFIWVESRIRKHIPTIHVSWCPM